MEKEELKGINKVRFCDYTQYEAEKSCNGGCYGFWTDYTRLEDGNWEVSYGTTADLPYCPVCGSFNDHYEGDDCCYESGYSCGDCEVVTEEKLLELINEFKEMVNNPCPKRSARTLYTVSLRFNAYSARMSCMSSGCSSRFWYSLYAS